MKASVIIPVSNAAPFLDKSIHSALEQKQTGEVLLIDDRSTDESLVICKKWEKVDSRVKVFVNEGTKGAGAARNVGLMHASCEYIAFLDADDYYLEGSFDRDEFIFKTYLNSNIICSKVLYHNNENQQVDFIIGIEKRKDSPTFNDIFNGNGLHLNGIVVKNKFLKLNFIQFDEYLKVTQDAFFILNLFCKGKILISDNQNPLSVHVRHKTNTTNDVELISSFYKVFSKKSLILSYKNNLGFCAYKKFSLTFIEHSFPKKLNKYKNLSRRFLKFILIPFFVYLFYKLKI